MESRCNQSKNHILRAIKATNQPFMISDLNSQSNSKESSNEFGNKYQEKSKADLAQQAEHRLPHEKDQFNRMYSMFNQNRRNFGIRKGVDREKYEQIVKKEKEEEQIMLKEVEKQRANIYNEMFFAPVRKSAAEGEFEFDVSEWMKKRKYIKNDRVQTKDQIDFARKLFYSWDDDGSGILDLDEIAEPLIALGLAPDKVFVAQLIKSLDSKFLNQKDEDLSVTLKDFLKIFRSGKYMKDIILKPSKEEKHLTILPEDIISNQAKKKESNLSVPKQNIRYSIIEDKVKSMPFARISTHRDKQPKMMKFSPSNKMKSDMGVTNLIFSKDQITSSHLMVPPKSLKEKHSRRNVILDGCSNVSSTSCVRSKKPASENDKTIPSLVEQFEIVKGYWRQLDQGRMDYEIPISKVIKLLVENKIAGDTEVAKKIIRSVQLNSSSGQVNYDEFKRIFCKTIFKNCLIGLINEILKFDPIPSEQMIKGLKIQGDQQNIESKKILPVSIRTAAYQRKLMCSGINRKSKDHKHGRNILNSLADLKSFYHAYTSKELEDIFNKNSPEK